VEFTWHPGLSKSQKQRSIASLHKAARPEHGLQYLLEISSKSEHEHGRMLSAFSLELARENGRRGSVETVFQGSKVFEQGGPFTDLYDVTSKAAKTDERLQTSGRLVGFRFDDLDWPLDPKTAFYDWLYLNAVHQQPDLADYIHRFDGFTDIEFNPKMSINCQAYSAALYASLSRRGVLESAIRTPKAFLQTLSENKSDNNPSQQALF
jgi:hypothetical protein